MKKLLFIIVALSLSLGAFAQAKLSLYNNKVEIDGALKAYAASWGKANGVEMTIKTSGGDSGDMGTMLKADYASGELPDIFVIEGPSNYADWKSELYDLSNENWVKQTDVSYKVAGKVWGFPVAVEGWGMAYNADILKKAGVDPTKLNNLKAYKDAFAKIDAQKAKLGLNSVVSMAAASGMGWVTASHNVNSYLSAGKKNGDTSIADMALKGNVDAARLAQYADWVELLFKYADKTVLTNGSYDDQVGAFANQKAAFIHQGNWIDPNLKAANIKFSVAYAPHGALNEVTDGVFVAAPSWYVVNKNSKNLKLALKYLNDIVFTDAGNKYVVNDAGMIPAFKNVKLQPSGPLSKSIQQWSAQGKTYGWYQYLLPDAFRNDTLAPLYNQWALGQIDKAAFISGFTNAIKKLGSDSMMSQ